MSTCVNVPLTPCVCVRQVFCVHGGIPRPVHAPVPQHVLSHYATATANSPHGHTHVSPPPPPHTPATKSPRSARVLTQSLATPARVYECPDLRLLALSQAPVPLKLLTIPPKPATAFGSPRASTLATPATPVSAASSVSADSVRTVPPSPLGCNTPEVCVRVNM